MKEPQTFPTLVTLAEWVNAGRCPPEALYEAGGLFVELRQRTPEFPELAERMAALSSKLGTDFRWGGAEEYRALDRIEVNADIVVCRWRPWVNEGRPHPNDLKALEDCFRDWGESLQTDWDDLGDDLCPLGPGPTHFKRRRPRRMGDDLGPLDRKYYELSLDTLLTQWHDTPEVARPTRFPLDPVVQAWIESREPHNPVPNGELLLQDYIPSWQRSRQDVRQAVDEDAKEMNGQDVHTVLKCAAAAHEKYGGLRAEDGVDLLIGLLRAADCELHRGGCPQRPQAFFEGVIAQLGRLGDVDHGRVERALHYAQSRGKYGNVRETRKTYRGQRWRAVAGV